MFKLFDDPTLLTKRAAAKVTQTGATMTATALAAPFVGGASLPVVTVLTGLPIKAALSTMVHNHREEKILLNFQEEIAAHFGIDEDDVTHDHLRSLAFGNAYEGIKPNPFFQEVLKRNDDNRLIKLGAAVVAAVTAGVFTLVQASTGGLFDSFTEFFSNSSVEFVAKNVENFAKFAWAGTVGVVLLATDHLATAIGHDIFSDHGKTAYEKIEKLAQRRGRGKEITVEQVMDLIVSANPELEASITQHSHGSKFKTLSSDVQEQLIYTCAAQLDLAIGDLRQTTAQINAGEVKINELAFISAGERSGVPDAVMLTREESPVHEPSKGAAKSFAQQVTQKPKQWRDAYEERKANSSLIDDILRGKKNDLNNPDMPAGSINFALRENKSKALSALEKLEARREMESLQRDEVTVH